MTTPVGSTDEMQPDELLMVHARATGLDVYKMQITALARVCQPSGSVECAMRQFSAWL